MTGARLAVVDVVDAAGPPTRAVATVESWARTLASPATRRSYRAAVRALLAEHGEITPAALAAWRDEMAARDLARATIRQRIAAVRAFAAWAARTGALPAELAAGLAAVKAPKLAGQHAPLALDEAQLRLMDRAAGAAWPDDPLRTAQARAVLRVLGGCGLRVSELAGAQLADLVAARPSVADRAALAGRDVDGWSLHVRGKGGRRRTVSVIASARTAVLALHRLAGTPAPALVPALTVHRPARVQGPPRAIAARTVQQLIGRLALIANELADGDVIPAALARPHALRHGFALRYLSPPEPGTLSRLQQLLGHDDIATTARYLAAVDERRAPAPRDPWAR